MHRAWPRLGRFMLGAAVWAAALGCGSTAGQPSETPPTTQAQPNRPAGLDALSAADLKVLFPDEPRPVAALGSAAARIVAEAGAMALCNDGSILWGDAEGRLVVVNAEQGLSIAALKVHDHAVERLAVGPRGRVVLADVDGDLAVVEAGEEGYADAEVRQLPARHTKEVTTLAISPDGRHLVSADENGNAFVWDLRAGTAVHTLVQEEQTGDGVVVSVGLDKEYRFIDARRFIGLRHDGFALWSVATGKPMGPRRTTGSALGTVVPLGDGTFLALHSLRSKQHDGEPDVVAEVGRYDETGKRRSLVELVVGDPVEGGLSPKGKRLVTLHDRSLKIWDLATQQLRYEVAKPLGEASAEGLFFSPDGKRVAVFGDGGRINVIDLARGTAATAGDAAVLGYLDSGRLSVRGLAVLSDREQTRFFDVTRKRDGGRFALPAEAFRFSADGRSLVGRGDTLWRMDLKTRELIYERAGPQNGDVGDGLAASADLALVVFGRGEKIFVLDGARGTVQRTIDTQGASANSLVLSPDGKQLAAGASEGATVFNLTTGRKLRDVKLKDSRYTRVEAWVGGQLFIKGQRKRKPTVWLVDPRTGEVARHFEVGELATVSPDGKWLASATGRELELWEVASAKRWRAPGPAAIRLVRFSDDGEQLLVGRHGIAEAWRMADIQRHGQLLSPRDTTAPPVQQPPAARARKDRHGDPLPPHALARLGTRRGRVSADVDRLRLRADGHTAWVIGDGGKVALWDLKTGEARREISFSGIYGVFLAADQQRLLSLSYGHLELRDINSGDVLAKAAVPDDEEHLAVTPDFEFAVTGNKKSGQVTVWDLARLKKRGTISGPGKGVRGLALAADGRHLAAMFRGVVRLHALAKLGNPKHEITGFDEYSPETVTFSPNGKRLYIGDGRTLHVVSVATGRTQSKWTVSSGVRRMSLSQDGRRMAIGSFDKRLSVIDTGTGKEVLAVATPTEIDATALSKDGRRAVVGTRDDRVVLYDVASGKALHTWPVHYERINSAAVTAAGNVVAADGAGDLTRWKLADGAFLGRRRIHDYHASFWVMPAGQLLTTNGAFQIIDPGTLATQRQVAKVAHGEVGGVTADERRAVLRDGRKAVLWDLASGKELESFTPHGSFYTDGAAISPDGKHILTGGTDGILKIWSSTLKERQAIRGAGPVTKILALADGTAVFRSGSMFRRVEVPSGRQRWSTDPELSTRDDFVLSRDGRRLITTDYEGILFVDMATGKLVARLPVKDGRAGGVLALSPDGKRLVTTNDRMMLIWDIGWVK